jgi:hypothetical protein
MALGNTMTTLTATRPPFTCYDVVLTLGVGGPHNDMVDELRRTAWMRTSEPRRSRLGAWLRHTTPTSEH